MSISATILAVIINKEYDFTYQNEKDQEVTTRGKLIDPDLGGFVVVEDTETKKTMLIPKDRVKFIRQP